MHKHYHFIGIGGIGMGTLASLVLAEGNTVSGSDLKENTMTEILRKQGAKISIGHESTNVEDVDCVVYSSAIAKDNKELLAAKGKSSNVIKRGELLAQLMSNCDSIAVAGAHGKTTTSAMIADLLINAGLNPTTAIGGFLGNTTKNATLGGGNYFVAELDESDGSFLLCYPKYSVITSIDYEHLDYYKNWDNIIDAYKTFISQTDNEGLLIAYGEDVKLKGLLEASGKKYLTYGFSEDCDIYAKNINLATNIDMKYLSSFECFYKGECLGKINLLIPGKHNILNALACICAGINLSIEFSKIIESLSAFAGVNRRFHIKGQLNDIMIVDDYAHHPTELEATIKAALNFKNRRLIVVFQPHRYSRTKYLIDDFVKSLLLSDNVIITDIYAASEDVIDEVSARNIAGRLNEEGCKNAVYLPKDKIVNHLIDESKPGDLVLTLGAGDIYKVGEDLYSHMKSMSVS